MKLITSSKNALYKKLKLIANNVKVRSKSGLSLLDGIHLAQICLQESILIKYCIVAHSTVNHIEIESVIVQCKSVHCQCICLSDELYYSLSQVRHGIGLLLIIVTPKPLISTKLTTSAVLLDRLQDPGNLGSILRNAAAVGIRQVFCSNGTTEVWSPKVLRAGMGAHFLLKIAENVDLNALCRTSTIITLATNPRAKKTIYEINLQQEVAWLFGHEGYGIQKNLLIAANIQVAIPCYGKLESINVASASAICFFEQIRQRQIK